MRTFILSDVEDRNTNQWLEEHAKICSRLTKRSKAAIEVGHSVTFTQTSVGKIAEVACRCGEKKDITDYSVI